MDADINTLERIDVAIGIVMRRGQLLICRRKMEGPFGGLWEFPGGKCYPDESPAQCVVRELREELTIDVEPTRELTTLEYDYPSVHVRLHPFLCELTAGEPEPIGCQQVEWIDPSRLCEYRFPDANEPLLRDLMEIIVR